MNIREYWHRVLKQDAEGIRPFFHPDAYVNWYNTNERFTAEEFIRANCEYPGDWDGEIELTVCAENQVITAVRVYSTSQQASFHVTSFFLLCEDRIIRLDEYWGDDGEAPQWRKDLHIGSKISE